MRNILVLIVLACCIGCAGTIKYRHAKRTQIVPYMIGDEIIIKADSGR